MTSYAAQDSSREGNGAVAMAGAATTQNSIPVAQQAPITSFVIAANFLPSGTIASALEKYADSAKSGARLLAAPSESSSINVRAAGAGLDAVKKATTALESFNALATPLPSAAIKSVQEARAKFSPSPANGPPVFPQLPSKANSSTIRELSSIENDSASAAGQRVIADTRSTLVGQIETRLEGALNATSSAIADGSAAKAVEANESGNSAAGQQGNTSSNSPDSGQRSNVPTDTAASGIDRIAAVPSISDTTETLKGDAIPSTVGGPAVHAVADATNQVASTATLAAASLIAAAPPANSLPTAKVAAPLPLPMPAAQQTLPTDAVKTSELYQRVDGSEMHVAMQTDLLGSVDLRATLHLSALTATISVQRSDVQALLANELPSLQHALADRNLHVEQISVLNNSVNERAGSHGQQPQRQDPALTRPSTSLSRGGTRPSGLEGSEQVRTSLLAENGAPNVFERLNIHV